MLFDDNIHEHEELFYHVAWLQTGHNLNKLFIINT